jgi:hypothetical protein
MTCVSSVQKEYYLSDTYYVGDSSIPRLYYSQRVYFAVLLTDLELGFSNC